MTRAALPGVSGCPDAEPGFLAKAGCRKVRRGDGSREADDGPPSPASGSRQRTRVIAPRGGTLRAAWRAKRARGLATRPRPSRGPRFGPRTPAGAPETRPESAGSGAWRGAGAVDRGGPSDIFDQSKKVDISRGFPVFYPSWKASPQAAPARLEGPADAVRFAPRVASLPASSKNLGAAPSGAVRRRAASRDTERSAAASSVDPRSGMSLAERAARGAVPRGSGARAGRRRHERVRFGVGQAWVRARRDAPHLLHGCVRT